MDHATKAIINLSAIKHNLSLIKSIAPQSKIMAVIKADAYGHGLVEIAKTLADADGLAVARIEEALEIRQSNIPTPLLLLSSYLTKETLLRCAEHTIDIVVHTSQGVSMLLNTPLPCKLNVWLKLNSGMYRLGMDKTAFINAYHQLKQCPSVGQLTLMSHFSDSESTENQVEQQMNIFDQTVQSLNEPLSLANSAAIIRFADSHRDWIRPGLMLYGVNPLPAISAQPELNLKQAMTLSAKIIAITQVPAGAGVGYNSKWRSDKNSIVACVGIGYGDGYSRHAKNGTPVLINGQRAYLAGAVSMDLITVDITHCHNINVGDDVVLWGDQLHVDEIAAWCGTIAYELLTSISKRVPRVYQKR